MLTIAEAATELRVCESSVYNLVASGDLVAVRIGKKGRKRIRRADLEAFVARLTTTRESGAAVWR